MNIRHTSTSPRPLQARPTPARSIPEKESTEDSFDDTLRLVDTGLKAGAVTGIFMGAGISWMSQSPAIDILGNSLLSGVAGTIVGGVIAYSFGDRINAMFEG